MTQHRTKPPTQRLLPLLLSWLWSSWPALAQIPSPGNAGGNSGNNASGSSTTPFSTPVFAPSQTQINAVNTAISASMSSLVGSSLASVVDGPIPSITASGGDLTNPDVLPDVVLASAAGESQQTSLSLLDQLALQYAAGTLGGSFEVSSASNGTQGRVSLGNGVMTVSTASGEASFPSTTATELALAQFAALGIAAGLTAQTVAVGAELVSVGVTPLQTAQLMLYLQGLAKASSLASLANSIKAFNAIVDGVSEPTLNALEASPGFISIRATLNAARDAQATALGPNQ